ncbi:MAG TPA: PQQ-dependent sugar dehydrogenase [Longimicrobiaceae bacterium]|nr:PQQ-dependent sugar dehydrogenase [Longimicrobiaceae bacterium]
MEMLRRSGRRVRVIALLGALVACTEGTEPSRVVRVQVSAPTDRVEVGGTLQLIAAAETTGGATITELDFTWSSSDASVATVSASGEVTGRTPGSATIQATADGKTGSLTVTVLPPRVAAVVVAPDTATLPVGSTRQLTATLRDAAGAPLTGRTVAWSSDNEAVAGVAADGTVTALDAGTAVITAESEGVKGTARITVPQPPVPDLALEEAVNGGFPTPTLLTSPPGDSRFFVVSVNGLISVVQGREILPEPFLDLRGRVKQQREMGMFSMVFHPRYASNGYFYVNFTDASGQIRIERYTVSSDPNRADPASMKLILAIDHPPTEEHFGGPMQFGPDGKLYIGVGDGGHGHSANAQDRGTLLGKVLRIDVDAGDPYAIPQDNPFVGEAGTRGEIWALGVRNPWRLSFDRVTGLLYLADVGENHWEEVNVVPASRGGYNFGWPRMEGAHCYPPDLASCDRSGLTLPTLEYPHPDTPGEATSQHPAGCSVTGGYVYRGSRMPGLRGHYLYGDLCKGWVRSFRYQDGQVTDQRQYSLPGLAFLVSFGQDASGEVYVLPYSGRVYRLAPAAGN